MNTSKDWYLYIIGCGTGQLYTGVTTDVARRFNEHSANGRKTAKFLRGKVPLTLLYTEVVGNHSQALQREIKVKKLTKNQKIQLITSQEKISDNFLLSKWLNNTLNKLA